MWVRGDNSKKKKIDPAAILWLSVTLHHTIQELIGQEAFFKLS